jgi:hypothetical protein
MATPPDFSVGQVLTSSTMNKIGLWKMIPPTVSAGATIETNGDVTFTTQSSVSLNGVFTDDYTNYKTEILISNSSQVVLQYRFRVSGSDNNTANYNNQFLVADSTTVVAARTTAQTIGDLGQMVVSALSFFDITFYRPKQAASSGVLVENGSLVGNAFMRKQVSTFGASTAFDGFTIIPVSGTVSGRIGVYGYT